MSEDAGAGPRWCVVANVVDDHRFGEGGRVVHGTRHFPPRSRVTVFAVYPGMCESVAVVGRHRGARRYVRLVMRAEHLTGFRAKLAYSPRVLELMDFRADGLVPIADEASARAWAEALPWWRPPHHGARPDPARGPADG